MREADKTIKICNHCRAGYFKAQKGKCPNCNKKITMVIHYVPKAEEYKTPISISDLPKAA